jgi:hypothetical protein
MSRHLPLLLQTAGAISADWATCQSAPQVTVAGTPGGGIVGSPAVAADESS